MPPRIKALAAVLVSITIGVIVGITGMYLLILRPIVQTSAHSLYNERLQEARIAAMELTLLREGSYERLAGMLDTSLATGLTGASKFTGLGAEFCDGQTRDALVPIRQYLRENPASLANPATLAGAAPVTRLLDCTHDREPAP